MKCTLGNLWKYLKGADAEAKLCAAIHDELLMLVREDVADKWKEILRDVMESAEARWLGDIPAVADVNVGRTWAEARHIDVKLNLNRSRGVKWIDEISTDPFRDYVLDQPGLRFAALLVGR